MSGRIAEVSLRPSARVIGVVYVLYFLTAICAVMLVRGIIVAGDAAATASNILTHQALFRLGFAVGLIGTALYIALTALLYGLFKPVNKGLALIAAFLSVAGCAIQASGSLFQIAPTMVLGGGHYLGAFNAAQLQALAMLCLNLNAQAGYLSIVFFGFFDFLIGYLIFTSTFLPRFIGVLMALAGLGWLTFLSPQLADQISRYVDILGFVAEAVLMVWLLVMGVDVRRWKALAGDCGEV